MSTLHPVANSVPACGRARGERGSALITTLMVMVIMTVMGLSFLVLSDTENQIAVSDRDGRQVLYMATSGATLVQSWFDIPDPAYNPFVPARADCDLSLRVGDSNYDGANDIDVPHNGNAQRYRGGTATGAYRLFDRPFRGATRDTFWGSFASPDVLITNNPASSTDYLDRMTGLFNTDRSPSLEGVEIEEIRIYAPPTDTSMQARYGICSASVTAAKVLTRGGKRRLVSQRTVTFVLQELPFPAPGAAIESAGSIDLNGNFHVHWGGTYTEGALNVPNGANFPGPSIPRENTSRYRFANFSPAAPDLDPATAGRQNLLTQLLAGSNIPDPWLNFRASGTIAGAPNADDQPWPYDYSNGLANDKSSLFQKQTYSFPVMDYDFWKRFTQQRSRNSNYFKYMGNNLWARNGVGAQNTFMHWVNTENAGVKPGIYFFDTSNAQNPQHGGAGTLVPTISMNSGGVDSASGKFCMEGVIYTNSTTISSNGIGSAMATRTVNMPSEPFLDTGIDINRNGTVGDTLEEQETIGNGVWDFAYANSTESDGQNYDAQYGTTNFNLFEIDQRTANGVVPDGGDDPRILADVVHEPYLNLAYPAASSPNNPCFVDFDYEATVQRTMGGDRDSNGVTDRMTSLRDRRGAQVSLDVFLNGVFYNEGNYDGSGNMSFYGSMLMKNGFNAHGTPDVYFNEGLVLGDFPPPAMKIPRVFMSQLDTE